MYDNLSVAIVDDEKDVVRTYELLFKRRDIPVAFVAYDGHSAIDKFNSVEEKPYVIIIDYRLPDMDGIELMKAVLALRPGTNFILISGDDTVRQEVMDAGASVFLKKPTGIKEITEAFSSLQNS